MSEQDKNPFAQSNTKREGVVVALVAVLVMVGLAMVTWNLIEGSEKNVDAVREIKVVSIGDASRPESRSAERQSTDNQVKMDCLRNPRALTLDYRGTALSDAGMKPLVNMTKLERLEISGTDVGDDGLLYLKNSPLNYLNLSGTRVTDKGLETIGKFIPTLEGLDLNDTAVTSKGIEYLTALPKLSKLYLCDTKIDGSALESLGKIKTLTSLSIGLIALKDNELPALAALPSLRILDLRDMSLTTIGANAIAKMSALTDLNARGTKLTDEGLKAISKNKSIEVLNLSSTQITDSGVGAMSKLPRLKEFRLDECKGVTEKGVAILKGRYPNAKIQSMRQGSIQDGDLEGQVKNFFEREENRNK